MALQAGIVGLPNVGKSTLFNAVSNSAKAQASNYRFCTIEPNVGLVDVPDHRMQQLADLIIPNRIVPTQLEIVDIAGLEWRDVYCRRNKKPKAKCGFEFVFGNLNRKCDLCFGQFDVFGGYSVERNCYRPIG